MSIERGHPAERKELKEPDLNDLRKVVFDSFKFSQGDQALHRRLVYAYAGLYPEVAHKFHDLIHSEQGKDFWDDMTKVADNYAHGSAHQDNITMLSRYQNVHKVSVSQVNNVRRWLERATVESLDSDNDDWTLRRIAGDIVHRDYRYMITNPEKMKMRKANDEALPLRRRTESHFIRGVVLADIDTTEPTIASAAAQAGRKFVEYARGFQEEEFVNLNFEMRSQTEEDYYEACNVIDIHIANHPEDADRLADLSGDMHRVYDTIDGIISGRR